MEIKIEDRLRQFWHTIESEDDNPIKLLAFIKNGIDINTSDVLGKTALMQACFNCQIDNIKILLQNRANPNLKNCEGWNALTYAALGHCSSAVDLLITANADINQSTNNERTPIWHAVLYGGESVVRKLLNHSNIDLHKTSTKCNNLNILALSVCKNHITITNLLCKQLLLTPAGIKMVFQVYYNTSRNHKCFSVLNTNVTQIIYKTFLLGVTTLYYCEPSCYKPCYKSCMNNPPIQRSLSSQLHFDPKLLPLICSFV